MQTKNNSISVGKILNSTNDSKKEIPCVPRSTARNTPPVCLHWEINPRLSIVIKNLTDYQQTCEHGSVKTSCASG